MYDRCTNKELAASGALLIGRPLGFFFCDLKPAPHNPLSLSHENTHPAG